MRLMLLGPPGAGKGTQAQLLCKRFNLVQISTGDMLRQAVAKGDDFGNHVRSVMESGALVSDEIIHRLIKERVKQPDCRDGFIFDGFPRTVEQAQAMLEVGIVLDHTLEIRLDDEVIIRRMSGRRIHPASGRIYHLEYNPPRVPDQDDLTGEALIQRKDDAEDTVRERLRVYHAQTKPLIAFFSELANSGRQGAPKYSTIDGSGGVDAIHSAIVAAIQ